MIVDSWHYDGLKNSLKDISVKISELENELVIAEEKTIIAEEDLVEENIEEEPLIEEDEAEEEKETEEIIEEAPGGVITLNGTAGLQGEGGSFPMSMTIDLKTGTVSGILYFKLYIDEVKFIATHSFSR